MEMIQNGLSRWFYLGILAVIIGMILIYRAKGKNKSKLMENGYFLLILGLVGIISEWTDFATVLLVLVVITGVILLIDKFILAKKRKPNDELTHYVHYAREFFPIVFVVWVLRAFLFEAYQIPSSSMRPDLTVGDFVLVNKFTYGIREPFINKVIIPVSQVKRGDVMVFKDQTVKNRNLIKRVVGVGGDKIEYYNKKLTINGVPLKYTDSGNYDYVDEVASGHEINFHTERYVEDLFGVKHSVITWAQLPPVMENQVINFKDRESCSYKGNDGFSCTVPQGKYFVMGDNRDNSADSRYWGFVPNDAILGRAVYVVINFHDFKRLWTKI